MVLLSNNQFEIYSYLATDKCSALYFIGDLNNNDFNKCKWYLNKEKNSINSLLLIYPHPISDTILTIGKPDGINNIIAKIKNELPKRFHAHFYIEHSDVFRKYFKVENMEEYARMCLNLNKFKHVSDKNVRQLGVDDHINILELLKEYPENFYTKEQLYMGYYYGIYRDNYLISVSGTHIVSNEYKIAALGNIITKNEYRNKGYSKLCISAMINSLLDKVNEIGLNVKVNNLPANKLYLNIGFSEHNRLYLTYCNIK